MDVFTGRCPRKNIIPAFLKVTKPNATHNDVRHYVLYTYIYIRMKQRNIKGHSRGAIKPSLQNEYKAEGGENDLGLWENGTYDVYPNPNGFHDYILHPVGICIASTAKKTYRVKLEEAKHAAINYF